MRLLPLAAACLFGCLAIPAASAAARQQTTSPEPVPRSAAVTSITETITIDGAHHLYVGVVSYDSEPRRVIGTQMARDSSLSSDDRVEILLDTFRDQRSAFYFATNPSGALVDGLVASGQLNADWDAIWDVRTRRTDQGWIAEFAIPFKSLSFPAERTVWGFNIARHIYRKLEENRWSGARLDTQLYQVSEGGEITNLVGLTQGIGLDVRPFLAGRWLHVGGQDDRSGKPGLDVFYNITPSLRLTATFNTDFGETEVDARQINLSRFSVLFPEKRSFFLQGAGVFGFASTGPEPAGGIPPAGADVYPFFSRQIGLLGGQEVPLDAGIKLTGTVGRTDVGLLTVRTGDLRIVSEKNFLVGRVKRNLFQQSYVGAIFTGGHPAQEQSGQTYGADMRLATSRFLGRPNNLVVNAYGVRSVNEGVPGRRSLSEGGSGRDWSYGFSAHYPNDKFNAQVAFREIQENFRPALGFVQRDNVRMLRMAASYNPRPKDFLNVQQMFHDIYYTRFTRLDNGQVESWDLYVTLLDWHLRSGDNLHGMFDFNPTYERLFESFEISPGVHLLPGEYRFTRFRSNLVSTAAKRRLSGSMNVTYGNYWSGKAEQLTTSLTYKLPPRFTIGVSTNQTFARLPEGHFIARIFTANVSYAASPSLSLSNLVQYDNRSRNMGWQSRVRWTLQPGNDLFFAFNQGWIREDVGNLRFRTQDSKVSTKFQYSFRF
ncbi:MAG: carbohydrate binding family 9 domain-containing protein [Acidobacteria bacterium]|nr:carbohydrate binding family 9 domain-containing protein [Acidobacteriota bacterium]